MNSAPWSCAGEDPQGITGGGDGGGGSELSVRAGDYGGFLFVGVGAGGANGGGAFFDGVATGDPDEVIRVEFGTDDCVVPPADTGTAGEITFNSIDAGDSLSAVSGAFTLTMARDTSDGISYGAFATGVAPDDADWVVSNSGSAAVPAGTVATLHVPTKLVPTGSENITTPGSAQEVSWTGAVGVNFVALVVYDASDVVVYECLPENDGSFTLPADVTSAAGTGGYIEVNGARYEEATFQGKKMLLISLGF